MYYYGGYSGGYNNSCGCNNYPNYGGCGCGNNYGGNYGGGYGYGAAIILVLFILLVIIIGTRITV